MHLSPGFIQYRYPNRNLALIHVRFTPSIALWYRFGSGTVFRLVSGYGTGTKFGYRTLTLISGLGTKTRPVPRCVAHQYPNLNPVRVRVSHPVCNRYHASYRGRYRMLSGVGLGCRYQVLLMVRYASRYWTLVIGPII